MMHKGVGAEEGFRHRGIEITRIEGFSDAVFAFAVTLLIVSLEVPKTFTELVETMKGFIAFACGFALLVWIWYNQYIFFRRYGLHDGATIVYNSVLLFVVVFFVYPLKFLFTFLVKAYTGATTDVLLPTGVIEPAILPNQTVALMTIYGAGYVAIFGVFALLYFHAYKKGNELGLNELEQLDTRSAIIQYLLNIGIGGAR